jgi:gas vesicle protein
VEWHGVRGNYTVLKTDTMKTSLIFVLGFGMGTVLGVLIAPEAGKITRRKIRDEADRIIDNAIAKKKMKEIESDMAELEVAVVEERYTI